MDNASRWTPETLTAVGSLRPDSADAQLPEPAALLGAVSEADGAALADLQSQVARFDRAVFSALLKAPAPAGLSDRILARLQTATLALSPESALSSEHVLSAEQSPASPPSVAPRAMSRFLSRRRILEAAAVLALAASVAGVAIYLQQPGATLNPNAVLESAREFAGVDDPTPWQAALSVKPPRAYPISDALNIDPTAARWRPVKRFLGRSGVAYDIASLAGARATLLVASLDDGPRIDGLPNSPSGKPLMTAGTATVAWQSNSRLYVLVVQGGRDEYNSFFRRSRLA